MKFTIRNQYENISLLKEANKINFCASNQVATSFPINAGGRKLLIGIDYNKEYEDNSIHTFITNGETCDTEGWSVTGKATKEQFIESALRQVKKILELIPDEDFL